MSATPRPFHSIYTHGFVRVAVCVPHVRVAEPGFNVDRTIELAREASRRHAVVALFPELGISAYSNDDLFQQDALLEAVEAGLANVVAASEGLTPVLLVGAPLRFNGQLFNCAVVVHRGRVLGIVPKRYLPNYREFYERRQFTPGRYATTREVSFLGALVPFGNDLVFEAVDLDGFSLYGEICEDLWVPLPSSTWAAMAGATVLANLSASNITVGKAGYRKSLCRGQSARCIAAYLYSAAGPGESTTDLAWDGHALIYENDRLLAESERFADGEQIVFADIDLERLVQDRSRMTSFQDSAGEHADRLEQLRRVPFQLRPPAGQVELSRLIDRFPYVPHEASRLEERCYEVYNIQVHGLLKRLESTGVEKLIVGVSGGLDSTQALIVAARTMDRMGLPRANVLGYTMPGFATSRRTRENAHRLMEGLGVSAHEIDIRPSAMQMFQDIGHPYAEGESVYDVTFENVQAGQRTSHLFRLANMHGGMVLGTGDLSEIALGWSTYGVGDHMSHYNVNASVPKTLIKHLIRWAARSGQLDDQASSALFSILETGISPELIPPGADKEGAAHELQSSESVIGPYELQDFHLYYVSRYGFRPSKVAFLAYNAWSDIQRGIWPELIGAEERRAYDLPEIKKWLHVFLDRFFRTSQFKRSALPDGPKVGSGGALSPRGDWRAPSDSEADVWLDELRRNVPST